MLNALLPRLQIFNLMTIDEWRYLQGLERRIEPVDRRQRESFLEYEMNALSWVRAGCSAAVSASTMMNRHSSQYCFVRQ